MAELYDASRKTYTDQPILQECLQLKAREIFYNCCAASITMCSHVHFCCLMHVCNIIILAAKVEKKKEGEAPYFTQGLADVWSERGSDVSLKCCVAGTPKLETKWFGPITFVPREAYIYRKHAFCRYKD